jgi:hypothetical protein
MRAGASTTEHRIGTRDESLADRRELLDAEKELGRRRGLITRADARMVGSHDHVALTRHGIGEAVCLIASPFESTTQPPKPCCGRRSKERPQDRPHTALIALCLHDDDRAFVEGWCIRLGRAAPDVGMRMVAAIGIGYLACRFRTVGPAAVEVVRTLAADRVLGERRSRGVGDALRRLERCICSDHRSRLGRI